MPTAITSAFLKHLYSLGTGALLITYTCFWWVSNPVHNLEHHVWNSSNGSGSTSYLLSVQGARIREGCGGTKSSSSCISYPTHKMRMDQGGNPGNDRSHSYGSSNFELVCLCCPVPRAAKLNTLPKSSRNQTHIPKARWEAFVNFVDQNDLKHQSKCERWF